jgi:hypothetical protein
MGDNMIIDGLLEKAPKVKEAVEKVENVTGKKIEDVANDVGGKLKDVVLKDEDGNGKSDLQDMAENFFKKN